MVAFLRHPVTLFALYDLITAISTMLKAFWFVHTYQSTYNTGHSTIDKLYRVSWAWGVLAGVSIFMTGLLLFALVAKSRIWAIVWSWWELAYIVAYTVLSIISEQVHWNQNMKAMQYLYMFFPRVFGLFGIILVVSYAMGPWKQRDRGRTTSTNNGDQVTDLPDVTVDSATLVQNK